MECVHRLASVKQQMVHVAISTIGSTLTCERSSTPTALSVPNSISPDRISWRPGGDRQARHGWRQPPGANANGRGQIAMLSITIAVTAKAAAS